ncbi:MAG: hypothetical protein R2771_10745 [Saprospiraceae bacterium]
MPEYIETIEPTITQPHEINDLIGNAPSWIVRSGITVIALVVVVGLIMSYLISYPDKLSAPVIITTQNPPVDLVSNAAGKIADIYVVDKDTVNKNDTLIYIENDAKPDDIKKVEDFIREYKTIDFIPDYLNLLFPENLQTGELNGNVTSLAQKFREFQNLLRQSLVFQKIKSLDSEIMRTRRLTQIQDKEVGIYQNEDIKEKEYKKEIKRYILKM